MLDGSHHFDCRCYAQEHTMRFVLDKDPDFPCIYASIYLDPLHPWWKRAWMALKYVFGYSCSQGHFDSWILNPEDVHRLRSLCDEIIKSDLLRSENEKH